MRDNPPPKQPFAGVSSPDHNVSASAVSTHSLTAADATPVEPLPIPILKMPPCPPPSCRPRTYVQNPLHTHIFQQAQRPLYPQAFGIVPIRGTNSFTLLPRELYPDWLVPRLFSTHRGRPRATSFRGPNVRASYPSGCSPRPSSVYQHRLVRSNHLNPTMQLRRAAYPRMRQSPLLRTSVSVRSDPMQERPDFLQPRVAPPSASIADRNEHDNARSEDVEHVNVRGRKVKITEGSSLYSLCRSWLRNGADEGIQQSCDTVEPSPMLSRELMMETSASKDPAEEEEEIEEDDEDAEAVKHLTEEELLQRHINRAKKVRAREGEKRLKRISKYRQRLAHLIAKAKEEEESN